MILVILTFITLFSIVLDRAFISKFFE